MNQRQKQFVIEYMKDLNATQAAIRAGYSKRTAAVQGHDLLRNPKIAIEIREKSEKIAKKGEITVEWVLENLKKIAEWAKNENARVSALNLIGKHLSMFTEKVDLTVNVDDRLKEIAERRGAKD